MVIFNRYKIVTAGFEKASKKLIHTGLREIGSFTSLSANDREVGWVANDIRLQPFCFSEATNLFGAFRDRP